MQFSKEQIGRVLTGIILAAGFTQVDATLLPDADTISECSNAFFATWGIIATIGLQIWGYVRRIKKGDVNFFGARV